MSKAHSVAILDDYQNVALKYGNWTPVEKYATITVFNDTLLSEDDLVARLKPFTIICTMRERTKFPASLLKQLPNLKLLTTTGMGNRSLDIRTANAQGVVVAGTGGAGAATTEHTWGLILGVMRHIAEEDRNTKEGGVWQRTVATGLKGRTFGLIGLGYLGQASAKYHRRKGLTNCRIAKVFGMNVIAWSPNLTAERCAAADVGFAKSKEELLQQSDVVSIHMVLSSTTKDLLKAEDLKQMKPTAFLVNTSRGPIVNEAALIDILKSRKIAGAALDVFDVEPLPQNHELRKLDNVLLSPHVGYISDENYGAFYGQTSENVLNFLEDKPVKVLGPNQGMLE